MKIAELLLQTLEKNGVRCIFGNPGTTEIPLVRLCERRRRLKYVVALSEVAAVPMADGYARAARSLGVVNLHVAPGLGNGMGGLYTAGIAGTPLLVLIGGQDRRFLHTHPILWGPVEKMAASVCKAVFGLNTRYDAAYNARRALRAALTPPYAPVALVCPPDLLEQEIDARPVPVAAPRLAALGAEDARNYVRFLAQAKRPAFIAAEDVHWNDAAAALETLAKLYSAPVYVAPYTGVLPVASGSRLYAGYLPPSHRQIGERLAAHDALLFVGGRGFRTTLHSEIRLSQPKAWIGNDPAVLAADGEFTLARVADTRAALVEIAKLARSRARRRAAARGSMRPEAELPARDDRALHPTRAVHALLEKFRDAIWVDEAGLSTSDVRQWMQLPAGEYLINGSGGIGWGLAAAVGAALACRGRQVVAVIGDGSALYASEALWTAEHHGTRMLLVILSNRRYSTLNEAAGRLTGGALDLFTIEPPVIDFSGLATLYGWSYAQASTEEQLDVFLAAARRGIGKNTLLELKLDPAVKPVTASRHF
ncbi:MAG: thiamine pyrophosphate-binding protein [Betaproteobacteria bacterium]|nr:thiamine pyrophosphate-binding protein [Betaproteobacteria bacterium]